MSRIIPAMVAVFAFLLPQVAHAADWYRAESQHFILYSEDSEEDTLEFVQDLERLNEALALLTGVDLQSSDLPPSSKLTVFRYGEQSDMSALATGRRTTGIGGFFIPRVTGSVAFVPRQRNRRRGISRARDVSSEMQLDPRAVLFHEYVHYFMWQHADAPYPLWYSEGFAEIFSTLEFADDHFVIGKLPTWRSGGLTAVPIDLEATFDPEPGRDRYYTARTYAHGWLIANHLTLDPQRRGQMGTYMQAVMQGAGRMDAAQLAFGDLDVLREELEEFRQGSDRIYRVAYSVNSEPEVEIRALSDAEEARMDLMIRSERGVDEDEAERLVRQARRIVERYPNDYSVLLAATEAEFDARNYDEAEALAMRAMEIDPQSTEAAMFYADVALRRSFENPEELLEARSRFAAANQLENDHAYPLFGYYLTYLLDEGQAVPDSAKMALEASFGYAAYDSGVRQALVHLLLQEDRIAEARLVGSQWMDGQGRFQCVVRAKFNEFQNGDREGLLEVFRPDHPGEYLDEDAREAEREEFEAEVEAYGCDND